MRRLEGCREVFVTQLYFGGQVLLVGQTVCQNVSSFRALSELSDSLRRSDQLGLWHQNPSREDSGSSPDACQHRSGQDD